MEITNENIGTAIAALERCAKENEGKHTDTGAILVSDLCSDVAAYLKKSQRQTIQSLTWEDMLNIHKCIKDAMNNNLYAFITMEGQKKVYEEVLERFKKQRNDRERAEI